jgi:hypothetical protein
VSSDNISKESIVIAPLEAARVHNRKVAEVRLEQSRKLKKVDDDVRSLLSNCGSFLSDVKKEIDAKLDPPAIVKPEIRSKYQTLNEVLKAINASAETLGILEKQKIQVEQLPKLSYNMMADLGIPLGEALRILAVAERFS